MISSRWPEILFFKSQEERYVFLNILNRVHDNILFQMLCFYSLLSHWNIHGSLPTPSSQFSILLHLPCFHDPMITLLLNRFSSSVKMYVAFLRHGISIFTYNWKDLVSYVNFPFYEPSSTDESKHIRPTA